MKKKIYLTIIILFLITIIWIIFIIFKKDIFILINWNYQNKITNQNKLDNNENKVTKVSEKDIQDKVEILKNRVKIKDLLSIWDNYFQNDQLTLALIKYKDALRGNPNDDLIIEKIWDTITEMKKFEDASNYYELLTKNDNFDISKYLLTLIYSKDLTKKENIDFIKEKINKNIVDPEKIFFYTNTLYCLEDFHQCKKNFDNKLITENSSISLNELKEVKTAIETYTNFWLVDIYYKNALMIWAFMKLKLYPISIILWKNLLNEKNDYKAIMQIISQSYFELWDYQNANVYLKKYFELSPNDSNAAYILWIINLKLWEYILSNIYFNKALDLWHKESLNVKRKLIYNYYILENYEKMYTTFGEMLKNEKDISLDDIIPVINYAMENKQEDKAYEWSDLSIKLFPKEPIFYAYKWKIKLDKNQIDQSSTYLNQWLKIDPNNQLLNYYLWLLKIKKNSLDEAKTQLNISLNLDKKSDLAKEIKAEIEKIENWFYKKEIKIETWEINN